MDGLELTAGLTLDSVIRSEELSVDGGNFENLAAEVCCCLIKSMNISTRLFFVNNLASYPRCVTGLLFNQLS